MNIFNRKPKGCEYLIVGLGNPGPRYTTTKHNAGFLALDHIAEKSGIKVDRLKHKALTGKGELAGHSVLLMKPQTYMNLSGEAVRDAMDFYKLTPDKVLVIYDDISLEPGRLRVRRNGSDGGHNGIKSLIQHIGSTFPRIKIGVGAKPHPDYDLADYVLSVFTPNEMKAISAEFDKIFTAAELIIKGEIDKAMNVVN